MTFWHHGPGRRLVWASMSHTLGYGPAFAQPLDSAARAVLPAGIAPSTDVETNQSRHGRQDRSRQLGQGKNSLHRNPDVRPAAAAPMHSEPRPRERLPQWLLAA